MNPAGRVRCNIARIAKDWGGASQLFFPCATLRALDIVELLGCFFHRLLEAPARPGLSFAPVRWGVRTFAVQHQSKRITLAVATSREGPAQAKNAPLSLWLRRAICTAT
jgi:hypothetical protein